MKNGQGIYKTGTEKALKWDFETAESTSFHLHWFNPFG
jgi:hypothetical protein